ncbi:MAG: ShlB/FhaC/HecB family hemolysin secretion/activation protein, partial [Kiritimatiellae bacterium]|nr:ShlB/FhaC/HecB family hemolysin secretion/activation protein [Kiritimatiellia bacterium]
AGAAGAGMAAPAAAVGGRVASDGQIDQMKSMEKTVEKTLREEEKARKKADKDTTINGRTAKPKTSLDTPAPAKKASGWTIGTLEPVKGDKDDDRLAKGLAERAKAAVSSPDEAGLTKALEDWLRGEGYYLCRVIPGKKHEAEKQVDYRVNWGHIRNVQIGFKEVTWFGKEPIGGEAKPDGRWFSKEQIRYRYLRQVASSNVFNYNTLYDRFYQLNSHPDITAKIALDLPADDDDWSDDDRALDVDVEIRERMPLHFVFDVDNNGTDASENWMGRLTAQYLNLTKHDDVLTFNYQNSLQDIEALGGLAGSYYLPHTFGTTRDFGATLYGGWTDVDSKDVVPDIDIVGSGWFAGFQESMTLLDTAVRSLKLSAGFVRRYVKDHLEVTSEGRHYRLEENEVTVMPFSLAAMYSEKKPDALHGLNFATVEVLHNKGDFLGTSDQKEMELQRPAADADYTIVRAQLARLQMLDFGGKTTGAPMLFAKASGQWSDGPLIPAEQMGLGGNGSVRGYATREYLGDHGIAGTLELRSPITLGFFTRKIPAWCGATSPAGSSAKAAETPFDRLQGVLFADAGYIRIEQPLPGEEKDKALYSVGLGARLALGENFQVTCDVGFPLEKTSDSDTACLHFNAQLQF